MTEERHTIRIAANSTLALLLKQAADHGQTVTVDTGEEVYDMDVRPAAVVLSPDTFYRKVTARADIRDLLTRLAK